MKESTMFEDQTVELLPARTVMTTMHGGGRNRGNTSTVNVDIDQRSGNITQNANTGNVAFVGFGR
jgi:hypothetical protein